MEVSSLKPGMVVRSRYETILPRTITTVNDFEVVYRVPAKHGGFFERRCLRVVWDRWCRAHSVCAEKQ